MENEVTPNDFFNKIIIPTQEIVSRLVKATNIKTNIVKHQNGTLYCTDFEQDKE